MPPAGPCGAGLPLTGCCYVTWYTQRKQGTVVGTVLFLPSAGLELFMEQHRGDSAWFSRRRDYKHATVSSHQVKLKKSAKRAFAKMKLL